MRSRPPLPPLPLLLLATLAAATPAWAVNPPTGYTIQNVGLNGGIYVSSSGATNSYLNTSDIAGVAMGTSNIYSGTSNAGQAAWYYTPAVGAIPAGTTQMGLTGGMYANPAKNNAVYTSLGGGQASVLYGVPSTVAGNSYRYDAAGNSLGNDAWYFDGTTTIAVPLPTSTNTSLTDPLAYAYSVATATGQYEASFTSYYYGSGAEVVAGTSMRYLTTQTDASTNLGFDSWYSIAGATPTVVGLNGTYNTGTNGNGNLLRESLVQQVNAKGQAIGWTASYAGGSTAGALTGSDGWLYDPNNAHGTGLNGTIVLTPPSPNPALYNYAGSEYGFYTAVSINAAGQVAGNWYLFNAGQINHYYNQPTQSMAAFVYNANAALNPDGSTQASAWTKIGLYAADNPTYYTTSPSTTVQFSQGSQVYSTASGNNSPRPNGAPVSPMNALGQVIGYTTRQINSDPGQPDNVATSMGNDTWVYYPPNHVPINAVAGTTLVGLTGAGYDKTVTIGSVNYAYHSSLTGMQYLSASGAVAGSTNRVLNSTSYYGTGVYAADAWVYDPAHGITTTIPIGLTSANGAIYELSNGAGNNNTRLSDITTLNATGEVGGVSVRYAFGAANGQDAWVYDATSQTTYKLDPVHNNTNDTRFGTITSMSDSGLVIGYDAPVQYSTQANASNSSAFLWYLGGPLHNQPYFAYLTTLVDATSLSAGGWSQLAQTSYTTPVTTSGGILGAGTPSSGSGQQTFLLTPKTLTWNGDGVTTAWNTIATNTAFTAAAVPVPFGIGSAVTFGNTGVGTIVVNPTWTDANAVVHQSGVYVASMNVTNTTGTYNFTNDSVGGETLTKSGAGVVIFSAGAYFGSATLNGGVTAITQNSLASSGSFLLNTGSKMVVQSGNLANITAILKNSLTANNDWSGTGIVAGTPTISGSVATHAIGVMTSAQWTALYGSAAFGGYAVQPGDVLLRYTYMGDCNFDGVVSTQDYLMMDAGYLGGLSGWVNGDFNYDGVVNYLDYALIDAAYAQQSGALADGMIALHAAEFGQAYVDAFTADVPEPASLLLLTLGGLALLRRKRRRQNHRG